MFTQARLFIKTGIGFLAAGLALGAYMLIERELAGDWPDRYLVSAHSHLVGVGFVMFMILGVALWIFPRPPAGDRVYRPELVVASYWLLTLGTAARFLAEAARAYVESPSLGWAVIAGGLAQTFAILLCIATLWPRIRPVGSHLRERKGERF